jgi:hypothetical protein
LEHSIGIFANDMAKFSIFEKTLAAALGMERHKIKVLAIEALRRLQEQRPLKAPQQPPRQQGTRRLRLLQGESPFEWQGDNIAFPVFLKQLNVLFRITASGKLAEEALAELESVSMIAMTRQLRNIMAAASLPRTYNVILMNVSAETVLNGAEGIVPTISPTDKVGVLKTRAGSHSHFLWSAASAIWLLRLAVDTFRYACRVW